MSALEQWRRLDVPAAWPLTSSSLSPSLAKFTSNLFFLYKATLFSFLNNVYFTNTNASQQNKFSEGINGVMMPPASISPIYPVVFYARALLLWWLRLRPASTGAHPAVLCYLLGSISGCAFCYSALLSAKHESSSSRRVNGNSQSPMGPCLTHHREDKSWLWLLQKKLSSH